MALRTRRPEEVKRRTSLRREVKNTTSLKRRSPQRSTRQGYSGKAGYRHRPR